MDRIRMFVAVLVLCLVCVVASSDEYVISLVDCYTYNDVWKNLDQKQIAFKYDDEADDFYLQVPGMFETAWIIIHPHQLDSLRAVLKKYFEWEQKAVENAVKIEKDIPDSRIMTDVTWKFGDDWYHGKTLFLYFRFLSQSVTRHQLIIRSDKVNSTSNQFIDYKLETLYLDKDQVLGLAEGIRQDFIDQKIEEHNKKKKVEDMFQ